MSRTWATSPRFWIGSVVLIVWSVLVFGAGRAVAGRKVVDELASPDGRTVAFVREEASLDPPKQSLWIGPTRGQAVQVARLAEDQDWADQIFWSPDGTRVGFLVRGSFAEIFDARRRSRLGRITLVEPDGYPGSREARTVAFAPDGGLRFLECARGRDLCFGSREVRLP